MALETPLRTLEQIGDLAQSPVGQVAGRATRSLMRGLGQRDHRGPSDPLDMLEALPLRVTHEGVMLEEHLREGRFQRSLALIAGVSAVLGGIEVMTEHYRGSYALRVMYSPIILSPMLAGAGVWAFFSKRAARTVLPAASIIMLSDGLIGFFFHVRGVHRKPGGWRIPIVNVIMGPPVFAPLLLGISGFLGLIASLLRREGDPPFDARLTRRSLPRWMTLLPRGLTQEGITLDQDVREGRFQQFLAASAALSALFNGVEAAYSHYKNNFRYPSQWTPIVLTPVIMFAGFGTVFSRRMGRTLLPAVSLLAIADGSIGFFYHLRGLLRRPGRLSKPLYNLAYGPPIFAPLLFAATGFLGLLASLLRREK